MVDLPDPRDPLWPIRITSYAPSHRQFRLSEDLTPDQITEALGGSKPTERPDGDKVTLQWQFWAELTYVLPDGGHGSTSTCCKIWDYTGARWSAYGWPEAFERVGLTPLMSKDYGTWSYEEDGNPTLDYLRKGLRTRSLPPSDEDWGTVVSRAIHEHLSRRDIMQYLDNEEDCAGLAQAALTSLTPLLDKVREDWVEEGLREKLADWQFNVMLECTRPPEEDLSIAIGGAVLDLRDLEKILNSIQSTHHRGEG